MFSVDNQAKKILDVVGIGNAIVDILIQTQDSFLLEHSLPKGSMKLVEDEYANELYAKSKLGIEKSGGSAANTLSGIAQLGGKAGFIGRVKDDKLGKVFTKEICATGAIFSTPPTRLGPSTARCLIFITPDAQRTMCTYLGASILLEPSNIDLSIIKSSKILYLEGYLWDNEAAKEAFIVASKTAKENGNEVALSLSDSFCVSRHRASFIELVRNHINILFANESEILSLFECDKIDYAIDKLEGMCEVSVITLGEEGSIILSKGERLKINSYKLGDLKDTTGAGDLYAGGFLYGYTNNESLENCGKIGSICAGHIVTQIGPRSEISLKDLINKWL